MLTVASSKYPSQSIVEVFDDVSFMSGVKGAPCTLWLKKKARQEFENRMNIDHHVFGFTIDEAKRHERFVLTERDNVLPILIDAKLSKNDCFKIIRSHGIKLPEIYNLGFPNANCIGCVKATSPTYWNKVRETFPEVFHVRCKQSREIGAKLVRYKGNRIFLDELPIDAKGRDMKTNDFECGLFCEEYLLENDK